MHDTYESDNEEHHRLRESEPESRVERRAIGELKGFLETLAILRQAVLFTSQASDSLDCTSSLTSELCALVVSLSVRLILQDDDPQPDVSSRDDEWNTRDPHQGQLPSKGETDDTATNDRDNSLEDGTEGHTCQASNLLRILGETASEGTSRVLLLVKVGDIVT